MFHKLISNLPFNPSLLGNVTFYAKRVHAEETLRRMGFGFVALAMVVQMFAVLSPPEKSLAYSNDYIINGLNTRDDILRAWDGKTSDQNVSAIYGRFGLSREDIAALPLYPNATIRSDQADYWTMGRTSLSAVSKSSQINGVYKDSEIPITAGSSTIYLRQLRAWDIVNPYNTYKAFEGTKLGKKFWILVDCGNLTQVGVPPLKNPALEFRKTIDGGPQSLKPGDTFKFRFEYRNQVADSLPAENVMLRDELDLDKFEIVSPTNLPLSGNVLNYPLGTVSYTENFKTALVLTVRLKANIENGTKTCNAATMKASNAPEVTSGGPYLCVTVINPCPLDETLSKTDSRCTTPVLACTLTNTDVNRTTKTFTLKTKVTSSNPTLTAIKSYVYDYGDGSSVQIKNSNSYEDTVSHVYKDGTYTATVVVNYTIGSGEGQTEQSVACSGKIESESDKPLSQTKTARNLTQNLDEEKTASTKAKANDTIEYNLITHNTYGYSRTNVNTSDYIGDILDYSTLDEAFLKQQGGSYDAESKTLGWTNQTVTANSKLTNTFRVKLKSKLPVTNQPSAMTTAYDCQLSNKFGNQLDIPVDCPLPKSAEYVTKRLPNTGPGTSLAIGFGLTAIVAYFFARSRLMQQELELIRTDFAQTGGI
ncbi:MAG: PKD domain-containing protein [bacterium]|nr:PKD domain-containing protein [bacterium]